MHYWKDKKITLLGAGSWATALGSLAALKAKEVVLWTRNEADALTIENSRENKKYLPGLKLSDNITITSNLNASLKESSLVVLAIPVQTLRAVFNKAIITQPILNASKGLELETQKRVSEICAETTQSSHYAIVSGPSFAQELALKQPTLVTIASQHSEFIVELKTLFETPYFQMLPSNDVVGVELAGALKNVIAIAAGMTLGLELGLNAEAAIVNCGLIETARLAEACGAKQTTFLEPAGIGDLVLTCTGRMSRNRLFGQLLIEKRDAQKAEAEVKATVEGKHTAKAAYELIQKHRAKCPILTSVYEIIYLKKDPRETFKKLFETEISQAWKH